MDISRTTHTIHPPLGRLINSLLILPEAESRNSICKIRQNPWVKLGYTLKVLGQKHRKQKIVQES